MRHLVPQINFRLQTVSQWRFLLILVVISLGFSQQMVISGTVIDRSNKEPLIGVNIELIGSTLGTTTDQNGEYRLIIDRLTDLRLRFTYLGYKDILRSDIKVNTAKPVIIDVAMEEDILSSETVTVSAGYFIETKQVQSSKVSLSKEEIRRFPGGFEDVVRTVSTLPGISINTAQGRNDLLVRGGGPTENLYVINNMEIKNINHFGSQGGSSGSLSFLNLDFVQQVDFSTGGFSAEFGDKMSSVLEIKTEQGRNDRIGSKLTISATQFGFNLEGPISKNGNFIFSARKSYLDLIFKANGLPFVPVYSDFNLIANFNLENNDKIQVLSLLANDRVDLDNSDLENRTFNAALLDNTQLQLVNGINYRHLLDNGYLDLTYNYNYNHYEFAQRDIDLIDYFNSDAKENEHVLKAQVYSQLNKNVALKFGAINKWISNSTVSQFADSVLNRSGQRVAYSDLGIPNQLLSESISSNKTAVYLETFWKVNHDLDLRFGLRFDHYANLEKSDYFSPRLSMRYQLSDGFYWNNSFGFYRQSPSDVWLINPANKTLTALSNRMLVSGFDYLLEDDLKLSVESYLKNYDDLPSGIIPDVTDYLLITNSGTGYGGRENDFQSFGYLTLQSLGFGESYGVEILLQKKYSDTPYYGQFSLSWSKSNYTAANGKSYPGLYDQRYIINLQGGYKLDENWEFSGKFRLFSGIPYTPIYVPDQNGGELVNLPEEYLSARLETGSSLDIRVDRYYYYDAWTLTVFLDIQNVL
ncbi:MAG: TonB-dependent receptor, partial [Calditrichaeota bacterium]|nr:TonB-dependent receptor [Calditrichota bacterium]